MVSTRRRAWLDLASLYRREGPYWYTRGVDPRAVIALLAGIAPCAPGFLGTVTSLPVVPFWIELYHYAWFISFAVSLAVYVGLMKAFRPGGPGSLNLGD